MTENEVKAIKWMKCVKDDAVVTLNHIAKNEPKVSPMLYAGRKEKAETIINGFEELEHYQAVGTVEEIKEVLQIISEGQDDVDESGISTGLLKQLLEYVEYAKIGTVKECREAMEKQRAKKPSILNKGKVISQGQMFVANHFKCPNCGIKQAYFDGMPKYCDNCGQKLDWSEDV